MSDVSTPSSKPITVGVIGAGVMGEALLSALISSGIEPSLISITEKREERAQEIVAKYGVNTTSLSENVKNADALLLVVKPQDMESTLQEIKAAVRPGTLAISFAAGKQIKFISSILGDGVPVIRVMPNTPTIVGEGMAGISTGPSVAPEQLNFVKDFLSSTGRVVEVDEELQDAVTAVSGSGPAYFFRFVEAMIAGGIELGLSPEIATELAVQTMVGAAKLLATSGKSATTLRENVTSPNGTTAAALSSFSDSNISEIVLKAMTAARNRSQELA
ncbi:MAG: pyrroline-5-carboxylate reductase [Actinomycetota bacterium]